MTDPNAARPGTAYCPCGGTCHHADHPCSLGCWAAQKPWRVEEAQQATAARLAAAEARVEALATYIHHDSLCRLHGPKGSCDCGLSAVLSRLDATPAHGTPPDPAGPIDVAWSECEAALPEGWWIEKVYVRERGTHLETFSAWARRPDSDGGLRGDGSTPAAALGALADLFRAAAPESEGSTR